MALPVPDSPWWRLRYELTRYGARRLDAMRVDFPAVRSAEYYAALTAYFWWRRETEAS